MTFDFSEIMTPERLLVIPIASAVVGAVLRMAVVAPYQEGGGSGFWSLGQTTGMDSISAMLSCCRFRCYDLVSCSSISDLTDPVRRSEQF